MTTEFLRNSPVVEQNSVIGSNNIPIRKLDDQWILPIFQSENKTTKEFLWNFSIMTNILIRQLDDHGILKKF